MQDLYNIRVITELPGVFLSDRWGDVDCQATRASRWYSQNGFDIETARSLVSSHESLFEEETTFLVGLSSKGETPARIGFWIEFEYDAEILPEDWSETPDAAEVERWHRGFSKIAPAMLHVAKGLADLQEAGTPEMICHYDFTAPNGGALSVFVPEACAHHAPAIEALLYRNALPFPPSSHASLQALSHLDLVIADHAVPAVLLPPTGRISFDI